MTANLAARMARLTLKRMTNSGNPILRIVPSVEVTFLRMKNTMTTKKIDKIIVYYEDGTYEEIKAGVHDLAHKQDTYPTTAPFVNPWYDMRPDTWRIKDYTITCSDKYTVTTNSTGNVDLSK